MNLFISTFALCFWGTFSFAPTAQPTVSASSLLLRRVAPPSFVRHPSHASTVTLHAKKKKKTKKGGNKKKSGFEWASSFTLKPFEAKPTRELAASAVSSYEGRTGKPLSSTLKGVADVPKALWNAPIACVIVNNDEKDQLVVKYANTAALETVGLEPFEFERLMTVDGKTTSNDDGMIQIDLPCSMNGDKKYEGGYSKKILKRGDDAVTIIDAQRWAIERSSMMGGKFVSETLGIAYAWNEWMIGSNVVCSPGGQRRRQLDVSELEEAIHNQAKAIRELKEGQGLGNKDAQVVEAVQELLQLKSTLADAQKES